MEQSLILNDGSIFVNSHVILNGTLFVYIKDGVSGLREVFDALIDPLKTAKITFSDYDGTKKVYRGYKKLIAVRDEGNGLITAVLSK